jgi:transcription antitermination protein NusB
VASRSPAQRRVLGRRLALQALYQWQLAGQDLRDIEAQFLERDEGREADLGYFHDLLHGVPEHLGRLDADLGPLLDRPLAEVDPVEKAALRIGAYELGFHPEVPFRVVINEAVELTKRFGAEQGHRYVNGILDRLARRVRASEVQAGRAAGRESGRQA